MARPRVSSSSEKPDEQRADGQPEHIGPDPVDLAPLGGDQVHSGADEQQRRDEPHPPAAHLAGLADGRLPPPEHRGHDDQVDRAQTDGQDHALLDVLDGVADLVVLQACGRPDGEDDDQVAEDREDGGQGGGLDPHPGT